MYRTPLFLVRRRKTKTKKSAVSSPDRSILSLGSCVTHRSRVSGVPHEGLLAGDSPGCYCGHREDHTYRHDFQMKSVRTVRCTPDTADYTREEGRTHLLHTLSYLSIEHASRSRRSTARTPNKRYLQHMGARYVFPHLLHQIVLVILPPLCFACWGHHLSPTIAIVFSLISGVRNISVYITYVHFSHLQHVPLLLVHLTLSHNVSSLLFWFATRAHLCNVFLLLPTTGIPAPCSSLWQAQTPYAKLQFQRFRAVHWVVQVHFHSNLFIEPLVLHEGDKKQAVTREALPYLVHGTKQITILLHIFRVRYLGYSQVLLIVFRASVLLILPDLLFCCSSCF